MKIILVLLNGLRRQTIWNNNEWRINYHGRVKNILIKTENVCVKHKHSDSVQLCINHVILCIGIATRWDDPTTNL